MKFKTFLILLFIYLISLIFIFFVGRSSKNTSSDYIIKLENDLTDAQMLIKTIEKRNEELINLNENQEKINQELKIENEKMSDDLQNIKEITISTQDKLGELENISNETLSTIQKLKNNNDLFREYIKNVSNVIKE